VFPFVSFVVNRIAFSYFSVSDAQCIFDPSRVGLQLIGGATRHGPTWALRNEAFMTTGRYEPSESSHIATAITFLLIGMGVGALAGLLLAPKTGKQLRKDLRRGYEDARDSVGEWADEAKDRVREVGERVREAGAEMADDLRDKVEPLRRAINRS
jgi:gas vesicle protein